MANKPFSIRDVKRNALNKVLGIQKKKMVQKNYVNIWMFAKGNMILQWMNLFTEVIIQFLISLLLK